MRRRIVAALALSILVAGGVPVRAQGNIKLPVGLGELEQRVKRDSNDAAAHYNVALAYWNAKRFDDVERELKVALALEPRFAPAHLALAYLPFGRRPRLWGEIYKRNRADSIRQIMTVSHQQERMAFIIDPLVNLAIIGATRPGKDVRWDMFEDAHDLYDIYFQGYDDIEQGRYDDAYFNFNRLLEMWRRGPNGSPPEEWIWWRAMAASRIPDKYDIAIDGFRRVLESTQGREESDTVYQIPLNTNEIRYLIATLHQRAGKVREAVSAYREVLQNDIGMYMAHVQLADLFESQRRYGEAIEERRQAANVNPDDPSLLLDLGVTLGKAGLFAEAVEALTEAASGNPRDSRAVFWLGLAELQLNHRDEAKAHFTRFVAMAPSRLAPQVAMARQRLSELQ